MRLDRGSYGVSCFVDKLLFSKRRGQFILTWQVIDDPHRFVVFILPSSSSDYPTWLPCLLREPILRVRTVFELAWTLPVRPLLLGASGCR